MLKQKPISQPVDQTGSCMITLRYGYFALVDPADFERLQRYKWKVKRSESLLYAVRNTKRKGKQVTIYMHRQVVNCPADKEVHHINGDTLDNRRENLRIVTRQEHEALHFRVPK